jgi:hypothetical protein
VFDDTYDISHEIQSRVYLQQGKVMGLSVAYNDDDDPDIDPKESVRDNFFGSVPVSERSWNDHWMKADGFGLAILKGFVK